MILRYSFVFILFAFWTGGNAQRKGSIELTINLEKKHNLNDFGLLNILINRGGSIDTLNTEQIFKKADLLNFKKANIRLNVDYGDRNAGFNRVIKGRGKIRFELYYNAYNTVKYIDIYALRDKFKYQEILHLDLRDQLKFDQSIHLNDWGANKNMNITFSGGKLFDLTTIFQESVDYTCKDIMFSIHKDTLEMIWFAKETEKNLIARRKDYIKDVFTQKGNSSKLTFGQLQFYIENSNQFTLKPKYQIHLADKEYKVIEF